MTMDVSELMKAFLTRTHRAITIAQRIAIGTLVVDARIIDATPEAAAWYGMAEPQCLIGSWISLLHHPDDTKLGRDLSAARHMGVKVPTRYVSRIRQAHAPEIFRPVLKDTTQIMLGEETYWVTILEEPKEPPLALQMHVWEHFQIPHGAAATRFYGQMSVAEMETMLQGQCPRPWGLSQISREMESQKSNATPVPHPCPSFTPGQTYLMPTGRYVHWCAVCGNLWRSGEAQPPKCGHRACHSPHWRIGKPEE